MISNALVNLGFSLVTGIPLGLYISNNLFNSKYKSKKYILKTLKEVFEEKSIKNGKEEYPITKDVEIYEWGFKVSIDIKKICAYEDFKKLNDYINTSFESVETQIKYNRGNVEVEVINKPIDNINFALIPGQVDKIPVGYNFKGDFITVNLSNNVGLLINGVPGVGKSVLLKQILRYLNFNNIKKIYYGQVVKNDLVKEGVEVAITTEEILRLTEKLLEIINSGTNKDMTYLIIDEFSFLVPGKGDADKIIKEKILNNISLILRIGRSEKVRIILTTQKCHSEFLPTSISSLLETKITFKCSDIASSTNVIGTGDATKLNKREFILSDGEIKIGRTFNFIELD